MTGGPSCYKGTVDSIRYYLALMFVVLLPGVYLYWFSIHPFVDFWRKVGPRLTLFIHFSLVALVAIAIFRVRGPVMSAEYGAQWFLLILAVPLIGASIELRRRISKNFSPKVILGLSELAPDRYARKLVTEGVYSRIRHPRYVQLLLAFWGYALFCNYLALYLIALLFGAVLNRVARLPLGDDSGEGGRERTAGTFR